jgi:zinc transport system permease protein
MDDFLLRALLAGYGVAILAGPLGTFIVWRRMAYFGEALSHSALLGIALGLLIGISTHLSVIVISILLATGISLLHHKKKLSNDTLLGIFSHASLSLGLIALSFVEGIQVDLIGYLFGDVLAVTQTELYWIAAIDAAVLLTFFFIWHPLLSLSVHEELAQVEGVSVAHTRLVFMLLIAVVVAVAMKVVGILLITSLLIIPAAAARHISNSPEQMAIFATIIAALSVSFGLWGSLQWDTPTGPSIVVSATLLFLATLIRSTRQ